MLGKQEVLAHQDCPSPSLSHAVAKLHHYRGFLPPHECEDGSRLCRHTCTLWCAHVGGIIVSVLEDSGTQVWSSSLTWVGSTYIHTVYLGPTHQCTLTLPQHLLKPTFSTPPFPLLELPWPLQRVCVPDLQQLKACACDSIPRLNWRRGWGLGR